MASIAPLQALTSARISATQSTGNPSLSRFCSASTLTGAKVSPRKTRERKTKNGPLTVVSAVGDVSSAGTTYLIAGAIAVALVGTAFPILFSRKDVCPECDGAGFVRQSERTLRANAARKDQTQIVCARCSGLGKLSQIDK
ncbi:uncharacterized protein LOC131326424 [Rhododendron vialii]|uniref:uncharacterized protein LOC131326424 n=1 Tax=Rhododendron vialii TaxID=182163 RepID=UPI00265F307B|nr:uncharacterized protein LOC131326424 [Rhododendron vialii]